MDEEYLRQLVARMQAYEFLLLAIIRAQLHHQSPDEAAQTSAELRRQFATLTVPSDARPDADLDELMATHREAQFFLDRLLKQAAPKHPGAGA